MARRTTTPTTPRTPAEPGQAADADLAVNPDPGPWPDARTLKGISDITRIREQTKDKPVDGWIWAGAIYGPGVSELDNHPALPIIRFHCRRLFGQRNFGGPVLTDLYDWLAVEKRMDKAAADALPLSDLAALLQQVTQEPPEDQGATVPATCGAEPRLTLKEVRILRLMASDDYKVTSPGDAMTRQAIVEALGEPWVLAIWKDEFGGLKKHGLTASKSGPRGGIWLTAEGIEAAAGLQPEGQTLGV
jgi:hypothetical protein